MDFFSRTRATGWYRDRVPLEVIAVVLGHSDIKTTRKSYASPSVEMLRAQLDNCKNKKLFLHYQKKSLCGKMTVNWPGFAVLDEDMFMRIFFLSEQNLCGFLEKDAHK